MIRITQRRARHVSTEAMQSTSRPATDEPFPDTCDLHSTLQWGYCSLACDSCYMEWPAARLRRAV